MSGCETLCVCSAMGMVPFTFPGGVEMKVPVLVQLLHPALVLTLLRGQLWDGFGALCPL